MYIIDSVPLASLRLLTTNSSYGELEFTTESSPKNDFFQKKLGGIEAYTETLFPTSDT